MRPASRPQDRQATLGRSVAGRGSAHTPLVPSGPQRPRLTRNFENANQSSMLIFLPPKSRAAIPFGLAVIFLIASHCSAPAALTRGPSQLRQFSTAFDYGNEVYTSVTVEADGTCFIVGHTPGPLEEDYASTKSKLYIHRYKNEALVWQGVVKDVASDFYALRVASLDQSTLLVIYRRNVGWSDSEDVMAWVSKSNGSVLKSMVIRPLDYYWNDYTYEIIPNNQGGFLLLETRQDKIYSYDSTGTVSWQMDYPLGDYLSKAQVSIAPNGEIVVAGAARFAGSGLLLPSIKRFSSAGTEMWQQFYPDTGANSFSGVTTDASGNIFALNRITGGTSIRKLDPSGYVIWQRVIPGYSYGGSSILLVRGYVMALDGSSYSILSPTDGKFLQSGNLALQFSEQDLSINPNGPAAAVGSGSGNALIEAFAFLPKPQDMRAPTIALTSPKSGTMATRQSRVTLRGSASDDVSPVQLHFRVQAPKRAFTMWKTAALQSGTSKSKTWNITQSTSLRGTWVVEVRVSDASGKFSATRRIRIQRN